MTIRVRIAVRTFDFELGFFKRGSLKDRKGKRKEKGARLLHACKDEEWRRAGTREGGREGGREWDQ